jgi:hypothetical protein
MSSEAKPKKSDDAKAKKPADAKDAKGTKEKKPKKEAAAAAPATEAPAPKAPPPPPRPPADPRLKVLKKFQGRFLPKGPLRDRYKAIMDRWNSGDDHGGVTVEELKALHADWRESREKPARAPRP